MRSLLALSLLAACAPSRGSDDDSAGPGPDPSPSSSLVLSGEYDGARVFEPADGFWSELLFPESSMRMLVLSDRDDACSRLTAWTEAFTDAMATAQAGDAESAQAVMDDASDELDLVEPFWKPEVWLFRDASGAFVGERTFGEEATLYFCLQDGPPDFIAMAAGDAESSLRRFCGHAPSGTLQVEESEDGEAMRAAGEASLLGPSEEPAGEITLDVELPFCAGYGPAYVAMLEYF